MLFQFVSQLMIIMKVFIIVVLFFLPMFVLTLSRNLLIIFFQIVLTTILEQLNSTDTV